MVMSYETLLFFAWPPKRAGPCDSELEQKALRLIGPYDHGPSAGLLLWECCGERAADFNQIIPPVPWVLFNRGGRDGD
jgi:hypothetical protein